MAVLRLDQVSIAYAGHAPVVRDVDLTLDAGETVAILGPSGGGKSTLLKAIAGLVPATGTIEVLGRVRPQAPPAGSLGYIPQRLGLVRHTSVLDNVVHGGLHHSKWWQSLVHRAPSTIIDRAWDAIDAVGLRERAHAPIRELSGGQQRRAAVARTLVQRPKVLLADEFLSELDPATSEIVIQAVQQLQKEEGTAVLLVEHQIEKAAAMTNRLYSMQHHTLVPVTEIGAS